MKGELWRSHGYIAAYEMWVLLRLVGIFEMGSENIEIPL